MKSSWPLLSEISAKVQSGEISAITLVEQALLKLEESSAFDTVISILDSQARKRARHIDEKIARGENVGKLAGVPFIAKDNFLVYGGDTTAASNMLKGFKAPYQSTAINRLEAEGAICIAKANLDAFAHGSSTENSDFMVTKNPHDVTRAPGGSSGGSAAVVALDIVPFALGTDTGGSIRLPASFCGVVGYKPTYGLVSRSGVVAMASSTDVIGPLTRSAEDAAYVLDVLAGVDELDSTTIPREDTYRIDNDSPSSLKGLKFGLINEYMGDGLQDGVRSSVEAAVGKITSAGGEVVNISLPTLPVALAVYYIICPAEVSSNLTRYDGQRYGYFSPEATNIDDSFSKSRSAGFGAEAKRRIMIGTYVLSSGYYDAYYKKAQTVRTKIVNEFAEAFSSVDFLIGPTAPSTAFKIGQNTSDPLQMYLIDIMTVSANLAGIPSISLPVKPADGLPVGLQIMAAQKQDKKLLATAAVLENVTA